MLIPLKRWAIKQGISPDTARQKAGRGNLPAVKLGRDWFIEEDAPNTDLRVTSGQYVGKRKNNNDQKSL